MEIVVERVSGLDVHKASVTACVRVPASDGERAGECPRICVGMNERDRHADQDQDVEEQDQR